MKTQKIYNLVILDASGSMQSIYSQALTGVNETLATIRLAQEEHPELEQYVSLASFSAGEYFLNRIYSALPIAEARDITRKDYPLLGCTALYDAMGTCISELQQKVTHDDRVLVTIITDGYENASRTWNGKQVKSLVEELRQMGWTFTYIGADQDVERVAEEIGVQNSLRFSANAAETQAMFSFERSSRRKYYHKMKCMVDKPCESMVETNDYFADDEPEKR
ncbi:MAG: VWA domain-containing protein [Bacteroidales bacterium]|nr:VWA domain-containing protein [Candidatus Minthousia equi]MDO4956813.1 VWA domain-containing protein [Bacteroidales bacterium]